MRSRSGSGVRLDKIMHLVEKTILCYQDPITGLFVTDSETFPNHAWVRDNVYAVHSVWAMYRAYQKSADFDEDVAKANELGLTCVKVMQSLLECMMRQSDKVESFKSSQSKDDALHAKYSSVTKAVVCKDTEWGHLQMDATSLFLLTMAQMSASGLQIVRNFDEVAFVQNLVYYIESAYRTSDFGIWERGDKTNQGIMELNASSIGMCMAALQALCDVGDLFGDGSKGSVIHVDLDAIKKCSAVLESVLPRESFSKETDAGLLSLISYPAFAVEDEALIDKTRDTICNDLKGKYGCRRFIRDGYRTVLEDASRLFYNNAELQQFENIECEWPLFVCYLLLDAYFRGDQQQADDYWETLQSLLVRDKPGKWNGVELIPELYIVPMDQVPAEKRCHGAAERKAGGLTPYLWAQSLYILCRLIKEQFLRPAELDPLSRRLSVTEKRPPPEVQVAIVAETREVQKMLTDYDVRSVETLEEIDPVFQIRPASVLAAILSRLGRSGKMKLSGRPKERDCGMLSTSKFYQLGDKFVLFTPQFMERGRSHLLYDIRILMDEWRSELHYVYNSWNTTSISGRPLVVLLISKDMFIQHGTSSKDVAAVIGSLKKIKDKYIAGARVVSGKIGQFFKTTAISKLDFRDEDIVAKLLSEQAGGTLDTLPGGGSRTNLRRLDVKEKETRKFDVIRKVSVQHRSIMLDSSEEALRSLRSSYSVPPTVSVVDEESAPPIGITPPEEEEEASENYGEPPVLRTSESYLSVTSISSTRLEVSALKELDFAAVVDMLNDTESLEEQATILHYLWMERGPNWDTGLLCASAEPATVRRLVDEIYDKACRMRSWLWVRISGGLLEKQMDELTDAVTNLLIRQKQLTIGVPSKNEEAITLPKTARELKELLKKAYKEDPNSYILAQEIVVIMGSLVKTDPQLFLEMFRLRIGLIIKVVASELGRLHDIDGESAIEKLLAVSPYELKEMLFSLLSGNLLESLEDEDEQPLARKEKRSGLGDVKKRIEERKSLRQVDTRLAGPQRSQSHPADSLSVHADVSSTDLLEQDDEVIGVWLRHRRIDGSLNRVPPKFYQMTSKEMKFALEVEKALNRIGEPEYRQMMVEMLYLLSNMSVYLKLDEVIMPPGKLCVDTVLFKSNALFIEHNREMGTAVTECCAGEPKQRRCDGARGLCQHLYDSAPAGEYGTAHYMIKAMWNIFRPYDT